MFLRPLVHGFQCQESVLCIPGLWNSVCVLVVPQCRLRAAELSIFLSRPYKILLLCSTCNILGNYFFFSLVLQLLQPHARKVTTSYRNLPRHGNQNRGERKIRSELYITTLLTFKCFSGFFLLETFNFNFEPIFVSSRIRIDE